MLLMIVQGCEAPLPELPPPSSPLGAAEAFVAWQAIAIASPQDRDVERAVALTSTMASEDGGLAPLVDLLGDASVAGEERVFAIVCLTSQRDALAAYEAQLLAGVSPEKDSYTRRLSVHVLGLLDSESAIAAAVKYLDDTDRSVRESAMGVLLSFHPERVADRLIAFWEDPETSPAIRDQVVLGMPPHLVENYLGLYASAATDGRMSEPARLRAISVLGQLGKPEHIAVLEQCAEIDSEPAIQEHARGALALLRVTSDTETVVVE